MKKTITPTHIRAEEEIKPIRYNLTQIGRLNKLNQVLIKKQIQLWDTIEEQIPHVERQLVRAGNPSRNYELRIAIQYLILKDSRPIYSTMATVKIENRKEMAEQMNSPHFDWSVKGMPVLKEPYCFLLGQLFQQSNIVHQIPHIALICTTIQFGFQGNIIMKKAKWTFVTIEEYKREKAGALLQKRS